MIEQITTFVGEGEIDGSPKRPSAIVAACVVFGIVGVHAHPFATDTGNLIKHLRVPSHDEGRNEKAKEIGAAQQLVILLQVLVECFRRCVLLVILEGDIQFLRLERRPLEEGLAIRVGRRKEGGIPGQIYECVLVHQGQEIGIVVH